MKTRKVLSALFGAAALMTAASASAGTYPDAYLRTYYVAGDARTRWWDGIDNQGTGTHVADAKTWVDLCGNASAYWQLHGNGKFGDTTLEVNDQSAYLPNKNFTGYSTIELCTRWDSGAQLMQNTDSGYIFILNFGDGTYGVVKNACYANPGSAAVKAGGNTYCFAATYSKWATVSKYYLGGTNIAKTVAKGYGWWTGSYPELGSRYGASDCPFKGGIHALRVYNRQLTAEEIEKNAAVDKARFMNDVTDFERLFPLQLTASAALDAEQGKIVLSANVRHVGETPATLYAIVSRSDGVVTTNTVATDVSTGVYNYDIGDLVGDSNYEVSAYLEDDETSSTPYSTGVIYVGDVSVTKVSDAEAGQDGRFVFSRSDSEAAMANDLVVNFTIGGTAVNGTDYTAIESPVIIPAGTNEVVVTITPLYKVGMAKDPTVTLTLAAGGYIPSGDAKTATLTIATPDFAADWSYDADAKTISDGLWTFVVSGTAKELTVNSLKKTYYDRGPVDFSKNFSPSVTIVGFSKDVLNGNVNVTELKLPNTLTTISQNAFRNCTSLTNVVPFLPTSVTYIGPSAFYGCSALKGDLVLGTGGKTVTIDGFSSDWGHQFQYTAIDTVVLGEGVKGVHNATFGNCASLKDVRMTDEITYLDDNAFISCTSLTNVTPFLPAKLTNIGPAVFAYCTKLAGDVFIGTNGLAVAMRGGSPNGSQFHSTAITSVTLGDGVSSLLDGVFCDCTSLAKVSMSTNLTSLGGYCFYRCKALTEFDLSDKLTSIGTYCFSYCSGITNITHFPPAKLKSIGSYCFNGTTNWKPDVVIGTNGVALSLSDRVFYGSGITSIRIGAGVKNVPVYFCEYCPNITNAVIEEGVQTIGDGAFQNSSLQYVTLPKKSLTTLGESCFRTSKDGWAYSKKLISVTPFLPRSITQIGARPFCCSANWDSTAFDELVLDNENGQTLTIAEGANIGWQFEKVPSKKIIVGRGVTALSKGMFQSMTKVRDLVFTCEKIPTKGSGSNSPFYDWSARQACVYVPGDEGSDWQRYLTNTTYVTPWANVGETLQKEFATKFPEKTKHPLGLTTSSTIFGMQQWIYKNPKAGLVIILR